MFIGQTVLTTQSVFTPWLPRQADNAIMTWELVQQIGGTELAVKLFSKNREDPGEGAEVGPSSWDDDGVHTGIRYSTFTGLREMVRFKVTASNDSGACIFRLLSPTWFDDAN